MSCPHVFLLGKALPQITSFFVSRPNQVDDHEGEIVNGENVAYAAIFVVVNSMNADGSGQVKKNDQQENGNG